MGASHPVSLRTDWTVSAVCGQSLSLNAFTFLGRRVVPSEQAFRYFLFMPCPCLDGRIAPPDAFPKLKFPPFCSSWAQPPMRQIIPTPSLKGLHFLTKIATRNTHSYTVIYFLSILFE